MTVVWTDQALDDLQAIRDWIALDNPRAAASVAAAILETVNLLVQEPPVTGSAGPLAGVRKLVVTKYRKPPTIYFREAPSGFEILHVVAAGRDWPDDIKPQ